VKSPTVIRHYKTQIEENKNLKKKIPITEVHDQDKIDHRDVWLLVQDETKTFPHSVQNKTRLKCLENG